MKNTDYIGRLANWFKKFKRYTVTYKKGAYHLYNLFNSPQTMIESFDKMAFCKHNRVKKMQTSDNIFITSKFFYCNPEDGLWVIISNLYFKKNVLMENLYDKTLPIEYHFINIHIKNQTVATKSLVNGFALNEKTWSVFKAGHAITEYHFKKSNEKNITVFFTTKWLEKQKAAKPHYNSSKLIDFFNSSNTCMILDEKNLVYEKMHEKMMLLADENESGKNTGKIKQLTYKVVENFIDKLDNELFNENHFNLSDKDRKNIQRVEQYLNDNLLVGFPGIEKAALKVGISPTKLKNDFKSIHNTSLYKYFSHQQMEVAHQLITQKNHTVTQVATLLGYENASKFSAVFKKNFEVTPSSLNEK
jgi:AraC-like DNA-binding protein